MATVGWGQASVADAAEATSLDGLVALALEQVPSLQAAQATARAQRAREGVAGSPFWPQVGVAANYGQLQGVFPSTFNGPVVDNGAANLTLRQLITNFGQTEAQVGMARATADAGVAQSKAVAVQVAFNVRQAYLQWVQARGLEAQSRSQLHNAEQVLARAESFVRHGARPRIDATRAEVLVAQARAALVDALNQVEVARRTLETAVGGTPVTGEPAFPAEPDLARLPVDLLRVIAHREHPSLIAGQALVRGAEATVRLTERQHWPDLSLNAAGGLREQGLQLAPNWQAGVSLAMPILTGGNLQHQHEAALEARTAAEAEFRDRALQVHLGVYRAHLALTGAREKRVALALAVKAAQETHRLAQNRYRDGVGSIIEISEAQTLLANAEAELVRGTANVHLAIAELQRALGLAMPTRRPATAPEGTPTP
jgi:outer membrane protein TolC